MHKIEKTPEFLKALELFEHTKKHIFLTGRAGTGKSTLLQYFRSSTAKNVVVLAPTGVAAVNVRGQTIHSFFNFRPDITPENAGDVRIRRAQREIYKHLDVVVIDEVSMVRADLLDCIDAFLRRYGKTSVKPFGGIQMVFIGDLYQLPPVVTRYEEHIFSEVYKSPFFFSANVMNAVDLECLELSKIYRQKEGRFIQLLNAVRDDQMTQEDLKILNERVDPKFEPAPGQFYIALTTTNRLADQINESRLSAIKRKEFYFDGEREGSFDVKNLPTQEGLALKFGAQVMLLNNDSLGRWVNGSIGEVVDVIHGGEGEAVRIQLTDGPIVDVLPHTWEMFRFSFNEETERVESEVVGSFKQYPIRLAWAVTIHKSQGKTFSHVVIDIGYGTFSHGQAYVALSRCTTLKGIVLKRPIFSRHVMMDKRVQDFFEKLKKRVRKPHLVLE